MSPQVSIIIPVYNVEQYLRQCLDSAKNQTLSDIEIICVDDGSTDNSGTILEEYAQADNRFKIVHQKNSGLSEARNTGLLHATGKYILFVDSDDYCGTAVCEKTVTIAEESNADMVQFLYQIESDSNTIIVPESIKYYSGADERLYMDHLVPNVWLYLYRRDFFQKNSLKFIKGIIFEDIPFTYPARFLANKIVLLPEVQYFYRVSTGGLSNSFKKQSNYLMLPRVYNMMIEKMETLGASSEMLHALHFRKLNELYFAWTIKNLIKKPFVQSIAQSLTSEEMVMIHRDDGLDKKTRLFYLSVLGNFLQRYFFSLKYVSLNLWDWFVERLYYRSSLYKKHEQEIRWLKEVIENHDEFFQKKMTTASNKNE